MSTCERGMDIVEELHAAIARVSEELRPSTMAYRAATEIEQLRETVKVLGDTLVVTCLSRRRAEMFAMMGTLASPAPCELVDLTPREHGHRWARRYPSEHWYCDHCRICGGKEHRPADVGECVGVPPCDTCSVAPAKPVISPEAKE